MALVALGLILFLVLRGGSGGGGILGRAQDDSIPRLRFRLSKVVPVPVTDAKPSELEHAARPAASAVTKTITALYSEAFLDPGNWRGGSYDSVWTLFDDGSRSAAQGEDQTLTLGPSAGDRYETVKQPKGKLSVKVLLDDKEQAATAVAIVRFETVATGKDGTLTTVVSTGQYFLHPGPDGWRIYSFSVGREDEEQAPQPGPSGSPSGGSS
ncbi:MAG TPA: hypothetical protein VE646_09200 [Actinomycetota bacterium]|nr:hypothetical protein [Actinomycetota bacterium]